ncbi:MAG: TRAP transporter small permease subunit [Planctomycetota bacterium]|nr:MAG: TRAP transporter small permease subunit [Planctomycetota bacterium]
MGRVLQRMASGIERLTAAVGAAVRWALLAMALLGAANAVLRYASRWIGAGWSSNALVELQWYLFGAVILLGAAHTLRHDAHVRVDVLYERLPRRARTWIDLLGHLVLLLPLSAWMVWISWRPALEAWRRHEMSPDPGGLPRAPIWSVIPLGFALLGLQGIACAIRAAQRLRSDDGDTEGTTP